MRLFFSFDSKNLLKGKRDEKEAASCYHQLPVKTIVVYLSTKTIQKSLGLPEVCSEEERTAGVEVKTHRIVNPL
jgi:hypothetical protein